MTDVIVTTHTNDLWLARCRASLRHYYTHEGKISIQSEQERRSWRDNIVAGLKDTTSEVVFIIQDDAQLMCLRPSWLDELIQPFTVDPLVAISCMTATSVGYPHQAVRASMPPGPYYTTQYIPIAYAARRSVLLDVMREIEDDKTGDHEPSLILLQRGFKIIMNTHLPVYHEGMQTNMRVYGGSDPVQWLKDMCVEGRDRLMKKYPHSLIQRLEQTEMVPMQNYFAKTDKGIEVRT